MREVLGGTRIHWWLYILIVAQQGTESNAERGALP